MEKSDEIERIAEAMWNESVVIVHDVRGPMSAGMMEQWSEVSLFMRDVFLRLARAAHETMGRIQEAG